ncbi:MAG: hypothetical protein IPM82_03785 [Saprospiraceae bacterium]|nr:hypothetical protein [Saprospiraceae bacterium]
MKKDTSLILRLELIWWVITAILLVALIYPIYSNSQNFPFFTANTVFILVFITLTRHIFLLKHTLLRHLQWAKVALLVLCIPLFIYIIRELHTFETFADEIGIQSLFVQLPEKSQSRMVEYTKAEFLFFGIGSLISVVIFPFRMLISFWRTHNLGTT